MRSRLQTASTILILLFTTLAPAGPQDFFTIHVVDDTTGRGVPLVELETVSAIRYVTDSAGIVAFHEPGLMNREVYFEVRSHGYEFPKDGFGFRGRRLKTQPETKTVLKIKRLNIAERLYRMTGGGIYRDSMLVGERPPTKEPVLNAQVLGSDSVVNAVFQSRLHWFWGDTNRPSYPLGNFHVPGATSQLPAEGGLDPSVGVDLSYFTNADGFAKETCRMPGAGPTWIDGLTVVPDAEGRERMFAHYVKVKPPLSVYEQGLVEFNSAKQEFEHRRRFADGAKLHPGGHPFRHADGGVDYIYFAKPYPFVRIRATAEALQDPAQYEAWTYYKAGADETPEIDRDSQGRVVLGWKKSAPLPDRQQEEMLIVGGRLKSDEGVFTLRDAGSGKPVRAHAGSVNWNAHRKKWIMIFVEQFGTSLLGEVWFAEADSPTGPWTRATKIVTHEKYSFYNPKQHPTFDQEGGRVIYFEGTYTHTFSGNTVRTPRYDYNQVMYRLDLSDERLKP